MIPRWLPPAYSPVSAGTLLAGGLAAMGLRRSGDAPERVLEKRFGARRALLTDSGTSALTLAILRYCADGAPVALPAYGCYDLATAADGADVPVVLYDLDPDTLAPNAASLHRALERGPGAVVVVHLYGIPVDVRGVEVAARDTGTAVIEDAAQGAGVEIDGRPAGASGKAAVLSFGRGKGTSVGGGGALLIHDEQWDASNRLPTLNGRHSLGWRQLAVMKSQWALARPALYALPASLPFLHLGETVYHQPSRPAPLSQVGREVLERVLEAADVESAARRHNASRLRLVADAVAGVEPVRVCEGAQAGYLRFPILVRDEVSPTAASPRARRLGIMPGYPQSLVTLEGFGARVLNAADDFPGAEILARRLHTLPTHSLLAEQDLLMLAGLLQDLSA